MWLLSATHFFFLLLELETSSLGFIEKVPSRSSQLCMRAIYSFRSVAPPFSLSPSPFLSLARARSDRDGWLDWQARRGMVPGLSFELLFFFYLALFV